MGFETPIAYQENIACQENIGCQEKSNFFLQIWKYLQVPELVA